jgi:nucleotide-binding universal stress UspA family protein
MTQSIVVAVDGSNTGEKALERAVDLAVKCAARLTVVHVLHEGQGSEELERMAEAEHLAEHAHSVLDVGPVAPVGMVALFDSVERDEHRLRLLTAIGDKLAADAAKQAKAAGVAEVATRVENGPVAETLVRVAADVGADLIVCGSRGLGPVKKLFLGSVSTDVVQSASCSVMVVK